MALAASHPHHRGIARMTHSFDEIFDWTGRPPCRFHEMCRTDRFFRPLGQNRPGRAANPVLWVALFHPDCRHSGEGPITNVQGSSPEIRCSKPKAESHPPSAAKN